MKLYEKISNGSESLSVIGLGYVGLPIAVAFAEKVKVIGFDLNEDKINLYRNGIDPTNEIGNEAISNTRMQFTVDENRLKEAKFHIIAVPTPINQDKTPNLFPVEEASRLLGRNLARGSIVVYESTVYPGVTEDICIPILEKESGLICGKDFKVGYSPERINPGDKVHTLTKIKKIVAGIDEDALDEIQSIYNLIIIAGAYPVSSIKVAEAIKVVENSQRDINIAFLNEVAMVFDKMQIDTNEVLKGMNTKWNSLGFRPGLVGGHCIGVDPYYFIYEAENLGYHSQIITAGRRINDGMGEFVADAVIKEMILADKLIKQSKVGILGLTFKENCPDIRNTKVIDIITKLNEYGIKPFVFDPVADKDEVKNIYNLELSDFEDLKDFDVLILAVEHEEFKEYKITDILKFYNKLDNKILIDVKSVYDKAELSKYGILSWQL